ncbi:MAG TPA: protocatechuate 3,4-dioxygenase [Candidatus Eisenbacteria bacterium]|nr:protocatechuate 3,4-dioxygenase [Candidatus Eisenbacteria bacterium]
MKPDIPELDRRRFLKGLGLMAAAATAGGLARVPHALAEKLILTPRQTEGPFYPDPLPLDKDNDLIRVGKDGKAAEGTITHLTGRILDRNGNPIKNALVEIWQVDANGVYLHEGSAGGDDRDPHFQGFGRFETASSGDYRFRTIKPVSYPGRTPHIHVGVTLKGHDRWTTQCYIKGEPRNERDGVLHGIPDPKQRESVIVDFAPAKGSPGELAARFDIVMGFTPKM